MASDPPDQTPLEAHTPPDQSAAEDDQGQLSLADGSGDLILSSANVFDGALPLDPRNNPPAPGGRGRGRPKGSKNKTTDKISKYLLAKGYVHPAEALAQLISTPVHELAEELSTSHEGGHVAPIDALKVVVAAAKELLPYYESKKPQDVHVDVRQRSVIILGDLPTGLDADVGDVLTLDDFMQEDQ